MKYSQNEERSPNHHHLTKPVHLLFKIRYDPDTKESVLTL